MMEKIWTGRRKIRWSGYTGKLYEPSISHHGGNFYLQARYIGSESTVSEWRRVFLFDSSSREFWTHTDTQLIGKSAAITYMASNGTSLEKAIKIMDSL